MNAFFILGLLFSWYIRDFDVKAEISRKNMINVSEIITVDFQNQQRHGIFRIIPSRFRGHPTCIKIHDVYNLTNGSHTYKVKYGRENAHIRIGDKNILVSGIQKYEINYSMKYVAFDTMNVERLVWNVTGNAWPALINHARFQLTIPENIKMPDNIKCYTGYSGSTGQDCTCSTEGNKVICETTYRLYPNEGLTVSMDFPDGTFKMPNLILKLWWKFSSMFWPILIPIITFILMFRRWKKYGRDPKTGPVVVSYEPPGDLTPIETGTLIDEVVDARDLTAEILNLALKGYIKIEDTPIKDEYLITKLKDCDENLKPFQCKILEGLFIYGDTKDLLKKASQKSDRPEYAELLKKLTDCEYDPNCKMVSVSSLRNKFYVVFNDVADDVYEELSNRGYFEENPKSVRDKYTTLGILVMAGNFIFPFLARNNPALIFTGLFSMIAAGFIIMIFAHFLPRKTKKGAEAVRKIKGLLEFVHRVEKERLKKFALEKPEMFKNLLPYAIALGEEKKWSEVFEEVYEVLQKRTGLNTVYISGGFSSMLSTMQTNAVSSPSSSSGGGTGGGFSGGGAGGGGGGAW